MEFCFSGIANDFYASTNSFMSSITETHNRLLCQTVLYVPKEALSAPIDIVSKDKEICSRLEAAMVHWIRQVIYFILKIICNL